MTFRASVLIGMTGEAATLVLHRQLRMASVLEQRQWDMAARQLIMAPAAEIGHVAGGAVLAIDGGVLAVQIISPSRRV